MSANSFRVDLAPADARAYMATAQYRLGSEQAWWVQPTRENLSNAIEIFHDGRWKVVLRTDWKDDVATGSYELKTLEQWIEFFIAKIEYGVRFDTRSFAVIDSYSDG